MNAIRAELNLNLNGLSTDVNQRRVRDSCASTIRQKTRARLARDRRAIPVPPGSGLRCLQATSIGTGLATRRGTRGPEFVFGFDSIPIRRATLEIPLSLSGSNDPGQSRCKAISERFGLSNLRDRFGSQLPPRLSGFRRLRTAATRSRGGRAERIFE